MKQRLLLISTVGIAAALNATLLTVIQAQEAVSARIWIGREADIWVIGPDAESRPWIEAIACPIGAGFAIADKTHLPDHMLTRLPTRVAHHNTDLARAYFWQGKHDKSLQSLELARKAAPQQTRHHPAVREVTNLLVRAHRRSNEPLARFRAWLGPDPEW